MTVLSFTMGIPILEGCIFILEMPSGGQHKKNYKRFSVYFWSKSVLYSQWLCNFGDVPKCLKYLRSYVIKEYTKVVIWEVRILSTSQGWCMWFMFCCFGLVLGSFTLMA